jgi:predicted phosphodiesterase
MERQLRGARDDWDVAVFGHTHKPRVRTDERGRLFINPGETSGWTFGRPTIALFDTASRSVQIMDLVDGGPGEARPQASSRTGCVQSIASHDNAQRA